MALEFDEKRDAQLVADAQEILDRAKLRWLDAYANRTGAATRERGEAMAIAAWDAMPVERQNLQLLVWQEPAERERIAEIVSERLQLAAAAGRL